MTCCLNPDCQQPVNPDNTEVCQSCGTTLTPLLRGRYKVVKPLGQGGFGRTYLATDEDRLQAPCVIKQFSPQFKGKQSLDKALALFEQEAKRLFELGEHPQIPTLLAYFEHDQRLYLVQQFIEGVNLAQDVHRHGCFDEQKIRSLLLGILPVLKFIHDRQIIHRDITPGNIIRKKLDDKLVLIDFGVAKQLDETSNSQAGTKIGTEGYSPIEQWRSGKAYPASDIYSLGATCLYLMTQQRPDVLYDPLSGRWLWREHLERQGTTISDGMGQILDKMLKDLVSERYQSAEEVMRDLEAMATGPAAVAASSLPKDGRRLPPLEAGLIRMSTPRPVSSSNSKPVSSPKFGNGPALASKSTPSSQNRGWSCIQTLVGHSSWVTAVALCQDGKTLVSGGLDDTIRVWDYTTGELLRTLQGHTKPINALAVSPDGKLLVSGSDDATVRIWDLQMGTLMSTLSGHMRDVNAVALSPDGRRLLSGGSDRTIRLWSVSRGELLRTKSTVGIVRAVTIAPNQQYFAIGGMDNKVYLGAMNTVELQRTMPGHLNSVNTVAITPNNAMIISGSKDKTIKIWQLQTGELQQTLTGHTDSVNAVLVNPGGQTIISGGSDRTIRFWNLRTGNLISTITEHTDAIDALSISPDGQTIASGSKDKTIRVWQLS
ncbi:MAG: serine/threonine protein kinase [Cyanobacteria bacterium]|nr:serine/threonine protein kinase [Cyanobacteriota bacterium]MDW8199711.1 serine/threonine-protein kinase [Cyanobacteriota bacterium SKYGB_h_bin112]